MLNDLRSFVAFAEAHVKQVVAHAKLLKNAEVDCNALARRAYDLCVQFREEHPILFRLISLGVLIGGIVVCIAAREFTIGGTMIAFGGVANRDIISALVGRLKTYFSIDEVLVVE